MRIFWTFALGILVSLLLIKLAMTGGSANPSAPPATDNAPTATASADKTALLQFEDKIHLVDLTTGRDGRGYEPIPGGAPIFSDDGAKLAAVDPRGEVCEPSDGGTACQPGAGVLHLVDLPTRRDVSTTLPAEGWIGPVSFSADATQLALGYNERQQSTVMLVDTSTGQVVRQRSIGYRPALVEFAPDRKTLAVYGQAPGDENAVRPPPAPQVALIDLTTFQVKGDQTLADVVSGAWCIQGCQDSHEKQLSALWNPAVVPSPDRRYLYIVHADSNRLTTIDISTGTVRTVGVQAGRSWFENLLGLTAAVAEAKGGFNGIYRYAALSPNGSRLFVMSQHMQATPNSSGGWDTTYTVGELQAIDPQTGRKLTSRTLGNNEGVSNYVQGVYATPDGQRIFIVRADERNTWRTEVFDADTLRPLTQLDDWRVLITRRLDGKPIMLAHRPNSQPVQLGLMDSGSFQVVRTCTLQDRAAWVSP